MPGCGPEAPVVLTKKKKMHVSVAGCQPVREFGASCGKKTAVTKPTRCKVMKRVCYKLLYKNDCHS